MDLLSWGYIGLFTGTFLSATFIPFSSDVILIGFYELGYDPVVCIIIATSGNSLGGFTNYFIGKGANIEKLQKRFKLNEKKIQKWQARIDQWGYWLGLISWAPIIGEPIVATLGFFKVKFRPVAIMMIIGKCLRYIITTILYFSVWG